MADINLESAHQTVQGIQSAGGEAISVEADVSKEEDSRKIADLTENLRENFAQKKLQKI